MDHLSEWCKRKTIWKTPLSAETPTSQQQESRWRSWQVQEPVGKAKAWLRLKMLSELCGNGKSGSSAVRSSRWKGEAWLIQNKVWAELEEDSRRLNETENQRLWKAEASRTKLLFQFKSSQPAYMRTGRCSQMQEGHPGGHLEQLLKSTRGGAVTWQTPSARRSNAARPGHPPSSQSPAGQKTQHRRPKSAGGALAASSQPRF